jgi:hypothetical protein
MFAVSISSHEQLDLNIMFRLGITFLWHSGATYLDDEDIKMKMYTFNDIFSSTVVQYNCCSLLTFLM